MFFNKISEQFPSASIKLFRAQEHRMELEDLIGAYTSEQPYTVVVEENPETGQKDIYLRLVKAFPAGNAAVIVGDAINNHKAAVDHLVFQLAVSAGMQTRLKKIKMPAGSTKSNFESQCWNIFKDDVPWLKEWLESFEIYPGGKGDWLYRITQINNTDKHKILTFFSQALGQPKVEVFDADGKPWSSMVGCVIANSTNFLLATVPPGFSYKIADNGDVPVFVSIADIERQPIVGVLREIEAATASFISAFEAKASEHGVKIMHGHLLHQLIQQNLN